MGGGYACQPQDPVSAAVKWFVFSLSFFLSRTYRNFWISTRRSGRSPIDKKLHTKLHTRLTPDHPKQNIPSICLAGLKEGKSFSFPSASRESGLIPVKHLGTAVAADRFPPGWNRRARYRPDGWRQTPAHCCIWRPPGRKSSRGLSAGANRFHELPICCVALLCRED